MSITLAMLLAAQTGEAVSPTQQVPPSPPTAPPVVVGAPDAAPDGTAPGDPRRTEEDVQRSSAAADVVVTARRRVEQAQNVPIPISVVGVKELDNTGSFNVSRLQQLQPTLQFYSTNPRNSSVNIRGLGAPLGLTNDGIDQGVGI